MNIITFNSIEVKTQKFMGDVSITLDDLARCLYQVQGDDRSVTPFVSAKRAVQRIYQKNVEEFTEKMTGVVKVTTLGGMQDTRVFSLRGAHLIAMFARTPVAKEFRRWVLDILDREVQQGNAAPLFASRVMLYMDEHGATIGSMPLREDEVVMSFDSLNALARRSDWIIERRVDLTRKIEEAIQNLH